MLSLGFLSNEESDSLQKKVIELTIKDKSHKLLEIEKFMSKNTRGHFRVELDAEKFGL